MTVWILLLTSACNHPSTAIPDEPSPKKTPAPLVGRLVDAADRPISGAVVLACSAGYCQDTTTRSDGRFRFQLKRPVTIALKAEGVLAGPGRRGAALRPAVGAGAGPIDVGDLVAPDLPPPVRLPTPGEAPREVELGDGLTLGLDRDALRPPVHTFLYEGAARRLPPGRGAGFTDAVEERVDSIYAVEPFGTTSATPIAVRVPSTLPDGTRVHFRTFSAVDGSLSAAATGAVEGGVARTDPGVGIGELSYLVVSRAP